MPKIVPLNSSDRVRVLNDNFRTTLVGGLVVLTPSVDGLPPDLRVRLLVRVQEFTEFTPANDPHREHDFGEIEFAGELVRNPAPAWFPSSAGPEWLASWHGFGWLADLVSAGDEAREAARALIHSWLGESAAWHPIGWTRAHTLGRHDDNRA